MYPVNFKKERAEYFVDCLDKGLAISPDPDQGGWTKNEMVQLAGACFFVLMSQGPISDVMAELSGFGRPEKKHPEHVEAEEELLLNDIHAAIEFAANLSMLAHDGGYDDAYEPFVQCGVT